MKLLTKRRDYKVMYSKEQAFELLKEDERVDTITWISGDYMRILTKPIIPVSENKYKEKQILLYPIGCYNIDIRKDINYYNLQITIKRRFGGVSRNKDTQHPHITGNICWGTANEEIDDIRGYHDWFWLAKKALDLLEDGDLESGNFKPWCRQMVALQCEYLNRSKKWNFVFKIIDLKLKLINYFREMQV